MKNLGFIVLWVCLSIPVAAQNEVEAEVAERVVSAAANSNRVATAGSARAKAPKAKKSDGGGLASSCAAAALCQRWWRRLTSPCEHLGRASGKSEGRGWVGTRRGHRSVVRGAQREQRDGAW